MTKQLSVTVMADRRRAGMVEELVERLGIETDQVIWDRDNNRWNTGRRAWQAHDPGADYGLVIQDDALVCRDLILGLEKALTHVPAKAIVSPFMGLRRPMAAKLDRATAVADGMNASWVVLGPLNWGVAIIAPVRTIPDMIKWCDRQTYPNYDKRVGQFYRRVMAWPTWHTWPNLVDHQEVPSLIGHGPGRTSRGFIGAEASALDVDWGGPVLNLGTATALNNVHVQQAAAQRARERSRIAARIKARQESRVKELQRRERWRQVRREQAQQQDQEKVQHLNPDEGSG